MSRDRPLLIYSPPRCGSTTLMRVLNCHPLVNLVTEPFASSHSPYKDELPVRWRWTFDRLVNRILTDFTGLKHVWHPAGWPVTLSLNHRLLRREWGTVLFLNRRNLLRQGVSNLMGIQSRIFHPEDRVSLQATPSVYSDIGVYGLAGFIEGNRRARGKLLRTLKDSGNPHIELWYEDLFDERPEGEGRHGVFEDVMNRLGLSLEDDGVDRERVATLLDPAKTKMNSEETYRSVPNIDEIEARLGNDDTGWIFQPGPRSLP